MLNKLFFPAMLVASLVAMPRVHAQEMGGGSNEKKSDSEKKDADTPKAEPAKTVKTLAFDKIEGWKVERSGGMVRAKFEAPAAEGDAEGAEIFVLCVGPKDTFDKELDFWCSHALDKDGKKFEKTAAKLDTFEVGAFKIRTAELSGIAAKSKQPRKSDKDDKDAKKDKKDDEKKDDEKKDKGENDAKEKKANNKLLACYIEGPDGGWVVKLMGSEKSFDKAREDFLKFVKTIHVVDKPAEEQRKNTKPRKTDDDDD